MVRGNMSEKEEGCRGNPDQFAFILSLLLSPAKHLLRPQFVSLVGPGRGVVLSSGTSMILAPDL